MAIARKARQLKRARLLRIHRPPLQRERARQAGRDAAKLDLRAVEHPPHPPPQISKMLFRKSACICSLVIKLCLVFIMRLSPTEKNAFSVVPLSFPLLLSCFQFLTFWGRLQSCRMVDEVPRPSRTSTTLLP